MLEFITKAGFPSVALLLGGIMVIVAIIRNIALEKVKIQLTSSQSVQLGVVGVLFIIGGILLQYFPPGTPGATPTDVEVYSTLYALQTQVGIPTGGTEQASSVSTESAAQPVITPTNPILNITPTVLPLSPTPELSPEQLTELFCTNFYLIRVRQGPGDSYPVQSIIENPNNISNPDCLMFDSRMPDSSWIRVAAGQENPKYAQHELGWVASDQFRPIDFDKLRVYIPENVENGLYCVNSRYGVKIRTCPNEGCREVGYLTLQDCVFMDGRSSDSQWVRISSQQAEDKYASYAGDWMSTYYLAPFEFSVEYQPYFRYYFDLLPILEQIPTPSG